MFVHLKQCRKSIILKQPNRRKKNKGLLWGHWLVVICLLACLVMGFSLFGPSAKQALAYGEITPPTLVSPDDGASTSNQRPFFDWTDATYDGWTVKYRLQISNNADFIGTWHDWSPISNSELTAISDIYDGTWWWRVQAYVEGTSYDSGWSASRSFTVDTTCSTPGLVSPSGDLNSTTPTFNWEDVTDPSGVTYNLEVDDNWDFGSPTVSKTGLSSSQYTLSGTGDEVLTEDTWYWRVKAVDGVGNESGWSGQWSFNVDTTPPLVPSLNTPGNGGFTNTPYPHLNWSWIYDPSGVTFNLQVDDDSDFSSPKVNKTNLSGTDYTVTTPLEERSYYWKVKAIDGAGNESAWSSVWSFTVDITPPPAPGLLSPTDKALTNDRSPTFDWTDVTDDSGVTYWLQVDNNSSFSSREIDQSGLSNSSYTLTWDLWQDGIYYWRVKAEDGAGGGSDWSAAWQFSLDATPPLSPSPESPPHDAWTNDTTPSFNWGDVAEAASYTFEIRYNSSLVLSKTGLTISEYTLEAGEALTTQGEYWWRAAAVDAAGNEGWSGDWRFDLDTTPPQVPFLNSPNNNSNINTTQPYFSWQDVSDRDTFSLQINTDADFSSPEVYKQNINQSDYYLVPDEALTEGTWYWRVRAVDQAGNASNWSGSWFFVVDTTPPSAPSLLSPIDGALTNNYRPTFDWEDVTDPSGVAYWLQIARDVYFYDKQEDRSWIPASTWTMDWDLGDNTWYWRVKAVDGTGNESDWSISWVFTIDTNALPSPEGDSPYHDATINNPTPNFNWSDEAEAESYTLEIRYNGSVVLSKTGLTSSEYTLTADEALTAEKEYWWRVAAVDAAGNESWGGDWRFVLDTTPPPVPSLNSPQDGEMINRPDPGFDWNEVDDPSGHSFTLQIDNNEDFSSPELERWDAGHGYGLNSGEQLNEGTWYWRVKVVDGAGNESNWSEEWEFTVQLMKATNITIEPNGFNVTSNEKLTFTATLRDSDGNPVKGRSVRWELEGTGEIDPTGGNTNERGEVTTSYKAFGYTGPETMIKVRARFDGDANYESSQEERNGKLLASGDSGRSGEPGGGQGEPGEPQGFEIQKLMPLIVAVLGAGPLVGGVFLSLRWRRRRAALRIGYERRLDEWARAGFDISELEDRLKK